MLNCDTNVINLCEYWKRKVLGIIPDLFSSAHRSFIIIPNLYMIQKQNEASHFYAYLLILTLLLFVTISLLLRDHQSLFPAILLGSSGATIYLQTDVYQLKTVTTWYRGFYNIFLYTFDAPALISFSTCAVGSTLWSHFRRSESIHEYLQRFHCWYSFRSKFVSISKSVIR
jgi:hypothetical protein